MFSSEMTRRTVGAYATALDIQDRINDYTLFQASLVRRHAQVFSGATGKVAAVFGTVVNLVRTGTVVAGTIAVLTYLHQHHSVAADRWLGPQLSQMMDVVPHLDPGAWVAVFVAYGYVIYQLVRLHRRLLERDARSNDRVATV
jgi:hypothetical protein